ncbi:MAG: hypothetical protein MJ195_01640 [Mycoplasmoidaceae bacterium]|nr:hypothetical protein [Mycoplasmoidaceae bacterium]
MLFDKNSTQLSINGVDKSSDLKFSEISSTQGKFIIEKTLVGGLGQTNPIGLVIG